MKATVGLHHERRVRTARELFREVRGEEGYARRVAEIAALPIVDWKGNTLYTIRCCGETGRGPHDVHVPLALVWSLLDLRRYRCAFH